MEGEHTNAVSQGRGQRWLRLLLAALVIALPPAISLGAPLPAGFDREYVRIPKQVALIVEPDRLLASNIRLNRIDELALEDGEQVISQAEARAVVVVATDRRIVAYGPVIGWREQSLAKGEQVQSLSAEDYAVFIITDRRYLNFNADSGVWGEQLRPAP